MKKQYLIPLIIVIVLIVILIGYLIYYQINQNLNPINGNCDYNSSAKSYIKRDPNCVIDFLCIQGSEAFKDACGCGCKKIDNTKNYCTPEQKKAQVCPEYYSATCGWFNSSIKCLKYPCAQTFSNPCFACADAKVEYYTIGECPA